MQQGQAPGLGESPIWAFGDGRVEEAQQQWVMVSCQTGTESREASGFGATQRTNSLGQTEQKKEPPRTCEKGRERS